MIWLNVWNAEKYLNMNKLKVGQFINKVCVVYCDGEIKVYKRKYVEKMIESAKIDFDEIKIIGFLDGNYYIADTLPTNDGFELIFEKI